MKPFFFLIALLFSIPSFAQKGSVESIIVECELDKTGIDALHLQTIEDMFLLDPEDLRSQFLFILQSNKFDGVLIEEFVRLSILSESNLDIVLDQIGIYKANYEALRPYEKINFPIINLISKDPILKKALVNFLFTSDYLMECEILLTNNKKLGESPLQLNWTEIVALYILDKSTFPLYQKDSCRVVNLHKIREAGAKASE